LNFRDFTSNGIFAILKLNRAEPKFELIVIQAQEVSLERNLSSTSNENIPVDASIMRKAVLLNTLISTLTGFVDSFSSLFVTNDSNMLDENRSLANQDIEEYSDRIISVFFSMLEELVGLDLDDAFLASPATICAVLSFVKKESFLSLKYYPAQLSEFVDGFVEKMVLEFMYQSIIRFITRVNSPLDDMTLSSRVEELEKIFVETLTVDCVEVFRGFMEWDVSRLLGLDFMKKVRDGLDSLWPKLFELVQVCL
jgi:hypothetical protein